MALVPEQAAPVEPLAPTVEVDVLAPWSERGRARAECPRCGASVAVPPALCLPLDVACVNRRCGAALRFAA